MVAGMAIDFNALRGASQRAAPTIPPCILVVAGHRPHKLGSRRVVEGVPLPDDGYEWGNPLRERARARLRAETLRLQLRAEFSRAVAAEARELDAMSLVSLDSLRAAAADAEPGSMAWDALARYEAEAARGDLAAEAERLRALPYVDGGRWRALHSPRRATRGDRAGRLSTITACRSESQSQPESSSTPSTRWARP